MVYRMEWFGKIDEAVIYRVILFGGVFFGKNSQNEYLLHCASVVLETSLFYKNLPRKV